MSKGKSDRRTKKKSMYAFYKIDKIFNERGLSRIEIEKKKENYAYINGRLLTIIIYIAESKKWVLLECKDLEHFARELEYLSQKSESRIGLND